jgi:hypothetical protein
MDEPGWYPTGGQSPASGHNAAAGVDKNLSHRAAYQQVPVQQQLCLSTAFQEPMSPFGSQTAPGVVLLSSCTPVLLCL